MHATAAWLNTKPRARRIGLLGAASIVCWAVIAVVSAGHLRVFAPVLGGLVGIVLFALAVLAWQTTLDDVQRSRLDLKDRWPLPGRRFAVFVLAALWLIVLMLAHTYLPRVTDALLGTLNVVAVLGLWMLLRPSPLEAIDAVVTGRAPLEHAQRQ